MGERPVKLCPYCKTESGAIGAGDETLDYCRECELVIEGQTIEEEDDELARAAAKDSGRDGVSRLRQSDHPRHMGKTPTASSRA